METDTNLMPMALRQDMARLKRDLIIIIVVGQVTLTALCLGIVALFR